MVKAKAGVAKLRQKAERRAKVLIHSHHLHFLPDFPHCRGGDVLCIFLKAS